MDQDDADDKEIKYHLDPNYTYSPVYVSPQDGLKDDDNISELPAQPDETDFDQYSGYVTVEADRRKALFYYLTESPTNSSTNPLLLWLQGVTVSFMEMEFCEFSPELSTRRQLLKDNIEGEADPTAKRTKQQQ